MTPETVARYMAASCQGGNASGCTSIGFLHENGLGISQDAARAADLYAQGCDGGEALGCSSLGFLYETGDGVKQDIETARGYCELACEKGKQEAWGWAQELVAE